MWWSSTALGSSRTGQYAQRMPDDPEDDEGLEPITTTPVTEGDDGLTPISTDWETKGDDRRGDERRED
jgi:hypothetical protein